MYKFTSLLVLFTLLLSACTLQVTTFEPGPIAPTSPALEVQVSVQPAQTPLIVSQPTAILPPSTETSGLLYFWPASLSPKMKFNSTKSFSKDGGYRIEFADPPAGVSIVLWAGTETGQYPYCDSQQTIPYRIRGLEGCAHLGTGAGSSIEWKENGVRYSVGGMGSSLEAVIRFTDNLEILDYQSWQQKLAEAVNISAARTRIQFIRGTTSYTSDFQELAGGDSDEYILGALAGQEMTVKAASSAFADSGKFILSISGADGSVLVSESTQTDFWSDTLPATQDYVIRVTNRDSTAQYQLKVNVPWQIVLAAGETSTTLEGRLVMDMDSNQYRLHARAGQTMTVTATSATSNACLDIAARLTDGSYIPLLRSAYESTTTWTAVLPTGAEYSQDYSISVSFCHDKPAGDTFYTLFVSVAD